MPYKNIQRKKAWEILHRDQRLARRRELRRIEAAEKEVQPEAISSTNSAAVLLISLAAHNPAILMGAGGILLAFTLLKKKGFSWLFFGAALLAMGLFLHLRAGNEKEGLNS